MFQGKCDFHLVVKNSPELKTNVKFTFVSIWWLLFSIFIIRNSRRRNIKSKYNISGQKKEKNSCDYQYLSSYISQVTISQFIFTLMGNKISTKVIKWKWNLINVGSINCLHRVFVRYIILFLVLLASWAKDEENKDEEIIALTKNLATIVKSSIANSTNRK